MDSITQAVLGAAIGERILGKRIGNKGAVLGAIVATIPDLDVLLLPFYVVIATTSRASVQAWKLLRSIC